MELFNKFKETVFYKDDSELEYQIEALEKVIEKYPNNPELNKNLVLYKLGLEGEKEIKFELKNENQNLKKEIEKLKNSKKQVAEPNTRLLQELEEKQENEEQLHGLQKIMKQLK